MKEKKARGRIKGQSLIENVGCMVALRACKSEWREKKEKLRVRRKEKRGGYKQRQD